jgi:hypothetical protein
MASLPHIVCVGAVFSALLIPPPEASAQIHRADYPAESTLSWHKAAPGLGAPVLNVPFSAEAVTTWRPNEPSERSEWRVSVRFYRDREGSVRLEQTFVDHADDRSPQRIVIASDPNGDTAWVLDSTARTVSEYPRPMARNTVGGYGRLVLPLSMTRFVTFERPQLWRAYENAAGEDEPLGEKTILGIPVTGTSARITLPVGAFRKNHEIQIVDERWISKELQLLLYSRTEDSEYGTLEHRVTRISRSDPPVELFEIPAGYLPIAPKYPLSFANPYISLREAWAWPEVRPGRK